MDTEYGREAYRPHTPDCASPQRIGAGAHGLAGLCLAEGHSAVKFLRALGRMHPMGGPAAQEQEHSQPHHAPSSHRPSFPKPPSPVTTPVRPSVPEQAVVAPGTSFPGRVRHTLPVWVRVRHQGAPVAPGRYLQTYGAAGGTFLLQYSQSPSDFYISPLTQASFVPTHVALDTVSHLDQESTSFHLPS